MDHVGPYVKARLFGPKFIFISTLSTKFPFVTDLRYHARIGNQQPDRRESAALE
jgi:hypothetical protein